MTSDPQAAQKRAANPFYKDPADAFWAGMGQDVADAMLGIDSGSNAMTMMNEARNMQPETQMQYLDYQIKNRELTKTQALEAATDLAYKNLDLQQLENDPLSVEQKVIDNLFTIGRQTGNGDINMIAQEKYMELLKLKDQRGLPRGSAQERAFSTIYDQSIDPNSPEYLKAWNVAFGERREWDDGLGKWRKFRDRVPGPDVRIPDAYRGEFPQAPTQPGRDQPNVVVAPNAQQKRKPGMDTTWVPVDPNLTDPQFWAAQGYDMDTVMRSRRETAKGLSGDAGDSANYLQTQLRALTNLHKMERQFKGKPLISERMWYTYAMADQSDRGALDKIWATLFKTSLTEDQKNYLANAKLFATASLRKDSGAALTADETATYSERGVINDSMGEERRKTIDDWRMDQVAALFNYIPVGWPKWRTMYDVADDLYKNSPNKIEETSGLTEDEKYLLNLNTGGEESGE